MIVRKRQGTELNPLQKVYVNKLVLLLSYLNNMIRVSDSLPYLRPDL
jgi:hypothetical protein